MRIGRWLNIAAWVIALLYVFRVLPTIGHRNGGSDFERMWRCAKAVQQTDVGDLYTPAGNKAMVDAANDLALREGAKAGTRGLFLPWDQTTFTPALLAAFALASSADMRRDSYRLHQYSKIAFGLSTLALAAALEIPVAFGLAVLLIVASSSESFIWVQRWGNIDCLHVSLLSATTCLLRGRRTALVFLAGAILGMIAAVKPTTLMPPFFLAVTFVVTKRWRPLLALTAGLALSAVIMGALPRMVLGSDVTWRSWYWYFHHFEASKTLRQDKSAFFAEICGFLGRPYPLAIYGSVLGVILTAAVTLLWGWASWKEVLLVDRFPQDAAAVAVGVLLFLLSAPFVFGRYFLMAVPATLAAMRVKPPSLWMGRVWMAVALLALYLSGNPAWTRGEDANPAGMAYVGAVLLFVMLGIGRYFAIYFDREPIW